MGCHLPGLGGNTRGRIARQVINNTRPGSIILLHDSGNLVSPEGGNRIKKASLSIARVSGL